MTVTVQEIVKQWLEKNGYDGLCNEYCGCRLEDFMPCEFENGRCEAGYKVPCPGPELCENDGDCDFHISVEKPTETTEDAKCAEAKE